MKKKNLHICPGPGNVAEGEITKIFFTHVPHEGDQDRNPLDRFVSGKKTATIHLAKIGDIPGGRWRYRYDPDPTSEKLFWLDEIDDPSHEWTSLRPPEAPKQIQLFHYSEFRPDHVVSDWSDKMFQVDEFHTPGFPPGGQVSSIPSEKIIPNQLKDPFMNSQNTEAPQPTELIGPSFQDQMTVFLATAMMEITDLNATVEKMKRESEHRASLYENRIQIFRDHIRGKEDRIQSLIEGLDAWGKLHDALTAKYNSLHQLHQAQEKHINSLKAKLKKLTNGKPLTKKPPVPKNRKVAKK